MPYDPSLELNGPQQMTKLAHDAPRDPSVLHDELVSRLEQYQIEREKVALRLREMDLMCQAMQAGLQIFNQNVPHEAEKNGY